MHLKCHKRFKDAKEHRCWSLVESVRTRRGVIKRQLLYLGEINDAQRAQWCSTIDVLDESNDSFKQMSLFPDDRTAPPGGRQLRPGPAQRVEPAPSAPMGRPLAGHGVLEQSRARPILGVAPAAEPQGNRLAQRPQDARWLPPAQPGQRVAAPPRPVQELRHGRPCSARTTRSRPRTRSNAASTISANTRPICFPT